MSGIAEGTDGLDAFDPFDGPDGVTWSARCIDVDSGAVLFESHPDRALDTASVGKLFLLHTLLHEVDLGARSLDDLATRRPSEWMDDSGLWYRLAVDTLSLYDIAALIAAVSDNAATNTLLRVVGIDAVAAHTAELGFRESGLDDSVRWPRPAGVPATLSHGSAREFADLAARIARRDGLSRSSGDTLLRWLGAGVDCSMVASAFGLDPLAHDAYDRGIWLWNKTGTTGDVRADVGCAMSRSRRLAYAVLARWPRGIEVRDAVLARMRAAGMRIRETPEDA